MTEQHTPSLPSGGDVGGLVTRLERTAKNNCWICREKWPFKLTKTGQQLHVNENTGQAIQCEASILREAAAALAALGTQEREGRSCTCHPDDNPPTPCPRKFAHSECVIASHARTIEALMAAAEPFAKAWVLIASQQQLAESLSLAQLTELACHELSGADFQRVARALKEHPNG